MPFIRLPWKRDRVENSTKLRRCSSSSAILASDPQTSTVSKNSSHSEIIAPIGSSDWYLSARQTFEDRWTNSVEVISDALNFRPSEFRQLSKIASGCYGPVLLLRQKQKPKYFALKVLQKSLVYRFRQFDKTKLEKRVLQSLQFPFLMNLKYAGQDSLNLYLVMDFLPGGDLWQLMQRHKDLGIGFRETEIRFYASQVILALEYLHQMDLVYRDLKPENIFMDAEGYLKIGDFGYTKRIQPKDGRTNTQCGTREYMAPEIVIGSWYNWSVDYWALGVLLYEFLTGQTPFFSDSKMDTYERIVTGSYVAPRNSSKNVRDLIAKLLIVDSGRRLRTWKKGWKDMKSHEWFARSNFQWDLVLERKLKAPFMPLLRDLGDTRYFLMTVSANGHGSDFNNNQQCGQRKGHTTAGGQMKESTAPQFVDCYDGYFNSF